MNVLHGNDETLMKSGRNEKKNVFCISCSNVFSTFKTKVFQGDFLEDVSASMV